MVIILCRKGIYMTKEAYLKELRANIKKVGQYEAENIMMYYTEYFEEAGPENVDKVIEELGNPKQLAQKACAGYVIRNIEDGKKGLGFRQKFNNTWILVTAIVGSPVWLALALLLGILVFVIAILVVALLFTLAVSSCALAASGVAMIVIGVIAMLESFANGLIIVGGGLMSIALAILLVVVATLIEKVVEKFLIYVTKKVIK